MASIEYGPKPFVPIVEGEPAIKANKSIMFPGAAHPTILLGVTSDHSNILMKGFPEHLAALNWDVHVVSSPGSNLDKLRGVPGITLHPIKMTRSPSVARDVIALAAWFRVLHRIHPDIISVGTPKAGLLGIVAGFLVRVPVRVYVLRGLRAETAGGLSRILLLLTERLVCALASKTLCVSQSLRSAALQSQLGNANKFEVIGRGSSNGVDTQVAALSSTVRNELRERYFPAPKVPIIGFVGRVTQDKGLDTLAAALSILTSEGHPGDCIIIGGDDEQTSSKLRERLDRSGWRVAHTGHIEQVSDIMQVMDVLCLPSLREGFPNVVLEAAVLGIACVGSDATGVRDAVVPGQTGLTFERGDAQSLAAQLRRILIAPELAADLGSAARIHASEHYSRDYVWALHVEFYLDLLAARREDA